MQIGNEAVNHNWIELRTRTPHKLFRRGFGRSGFSIGLVAGHRVEAFGDSNDPRAQRNFVVAQPSGIAATVESLVMVEQQLAYFFKAFDTVQDHPAELRML